MKFKMLQLCFVFQIFLRQSSSKLINKKFPENFLFGVATSAYQIEGASLEDGKGKNIWDHYLHTRHDQTDNGDIACDSYHKYLDDVKMLKALGVNFYRFSISWSRILPSGFTNKINEDGVNYYRKLINALKDNGIEPYVTLYHWDLPQSLQEIGGWPNPLLVDYFADYARTTFSLFGDKVKNWITFNEPVQFCQSGYGNEGGAPGVLLDGIAPYQCGYTVLKAHAKAYHIYDEEFRKSQKGRVSIAIDTNYIESASDDQRDKDAADRALQFIYGWFAHPIYHPDGNYPQIMIERIAENSKKEGFLHSRLPELTAKEAEYIKGTYDFLCLNSYTTLLAKWYDDFPFKTPGFLNDMGVFLYQDPTWKTSAADWLKVVPWGIRKLLNWINANFDHPEIMVTENGYPDHGELDDHDRIHYFSEYLSNILQAVLEDGVNVTGYTLWSLMDSFEWLGGFTQKFGLFHVDFNDANRTRTIKRSGQYYNKVITTRCLIDSCVNSNKSVYVRLPNNMVVMEESSGHYGALHNDRVRRPLSVTTVKTN